MVNRLLRTAGFHRMIANQESGTYDAYIDGDNYKDIKFPSELMESLTFRLGKTEGLKEAAVLLMNKAIENFKEEDDEQAVYLRAISVTLNNYADQLHLEIGSDVKAHICSTAELQK